MNGLYLDEVIEKTGISERNVKYWSQKYELPVEKDGRRNLYPPRTVKLLKLVNLLSDSELFTQHFIRLQVQRALNFSDSKISAVAEYEKVRNQGSKIMATISSARGHQILPELKSSRAGKTVSAPRKKPTKTDIDEAIL